MYGIWKTFYLLMVNADVKNVTDKNVTKLSIYFSHNILSRIPSEYQTVLIKLRPDTL